MSTDLLLWLVAALLLLAVVAFALVVRHLQRSQARQLELAAHELRAQFADTAQSALSGNTEHFLRLARESFAREQQQAESNLRAREVAVGALVEPLRQALARSEQQLAVLERERRDAYATLRTQIEGLAAGQSALQRETQHLVGALKRPEVRGRWGEITLRRVVELAGLSEHCDFIEQGAVAGGALRPDLVVRLPENRELVVDAKTPLDAYLAAIEATTDEQRALALTRHAQQVEARVRELAGKAYWNQFEHSPDFAVLFLPGDQFLSAALTERPDLLDTALRQQVLIATPATLVALLKVVAYGWRQSLVSENAARIRELGQELHQRLGTFINHFAKAGKQLGSALGAYNDAVGSLERSVLPQARRFNELGAATGQPLPELEPLTIAPRLPAGGGEASMPERKQD